MTDAPFRWFFLAILLGMFVISGTFRRRARIEGGTIPRMQEGRAAVLARLLLALVLYVPFLAYLLNPRWMDWARVPLPMGLRWAGVVLGLLMVVFLYWVMTSIGKNVSETVLTKQDHALVVRGPYRWIRHPLYSAAIGALFALGLVAANVWMMVLAGLAGIVMAVFIVPREEAELVRKFGEEYRAYQARSGRFVPRFTKSQ